MPTEIPDDDWDETETESVAEDESPAFDLDVDPVVIRDDSPDEPRDEATGGSDMASTALDPDLDNVLVEFVELVNARDMDGLAELLAPEAEAAFLGELSPTGLIDGLGDLIFRHPDLVVTRGDLGPEPIAAVWLLDADADHYRFAGMFTLELSDVANGMIGRIDYVEEPPDGDLVVEVPDDSERPEWEDWSAQDET